MHEDERPTGRDNLAKAREVSGLGEDVCFLNTYNPNQGKNPRVGMDAADRSDGFDTSGLEEAMAKVEADVVAVITPPDTHAPCALAAVRAGNPAARANATYNTVCSLQSPLPASSTCLALGTLSVISLSRFA